jgi:holin-like protein
VGIFILWLHSNFTQTHYNQPKQQQEKRMIDGLVQIFIWQGLGELVSKFLLPNIPGPVIGLILLVAYLVFKGEVNKPLGIVADTFRQHLGLLFVPASVGVILFLPDLKTHAIAVTIALLVSVVLAIAVTGLVLRLFWRATHDE